MPNSNIYEKGSVLPGGGGLNPILRQDLKLQNPIQPQLQTQSPLGLQPVAQQMTQQLTPTLKQNYFASKPTVPETAVQTQKTVPAAPLSQGYTPSATNPTQSVFDYLLAPSEEEKKLYKNNESKKRLLLLSDALRHLGNIYNTTRGATPQQFNSPVVEQEQQYLRKRNEIRAQRAAALKNAMDQAKLDADQNYKNSMLGMRAAELERQRANDDWNKQFNLGKFAYNQEKDKNDLALRLAAQGETQRHNKAAEGLRAKGLGLESQRIGLARERFNWEKSAFGGAPKGYTFMPHYENENGVDVSWVVNEKKYKNYLPRIYKALVDKKIVKPIKDSKGVNISLSNLNLDTNTSEGEANFKKMDELVKSASWSKTYSDWMQTMGAVRSDGKQVKVVRKQDLRKKFQPKQQGAKPQSLGDKYSKYERN